MMVSVVAHSPRVTKGGFAARLSALQVRRCPAWKCPSHPCIGSHPGIPTHTPHQSLRCAVTYNLPRPRHSISPRTYHLPQPALGRPQVELIWRAVNPHNAGTVEVAALHAMLAARFGRDKTAGKGANVIDKVIAKVREGGGAQGEVCMYVCVCVCVCVCVRLSLFVGVCLRVAWKCCCSL